MEAYKAANVRYKLFLRERLYAQIEKTKETGEGFAIDSAGALQFLKMSGYAVALTDDKIEPETLSSLIDDRIEWLLENSIFKNRIAGVWKDGDDFFFDKAINVEKLEYAVWLGKLMNQKSIWDYKNRQEIKII